MQHAIKDLDRESGGAKQGSRRKSSVKHAANRSRKTLKMQKKRVAHKGSAPRRKRVPRMKEEPAFQTFATEPPPIIPQPSLTSPDEEIEEESQEEREEPPPPSALTAHPGCPEGDSDDLFEYVF
jgi:hypothetical protein